MPNAPVCNYGALAVDVETEESTTNACLQVFKMSVICNLQYRFSQTTLTFPRNLWFHNPLSLRGPCGNISAPSSMFSRPHSLSRLDQTCLVFRERPSGPGLQPDAEVRMS